MPHHQGALDELCGVYSIINAMKLLRNDKATASQELFNEIIYHLQEKKDLAEIIIHGMSIKTLYNTINEVIDRKEIIRNMIYRGKSASLTEVWNSMVKHLNNPDYIASTIIIGISWSEDAGHWSVVRKITNKTIQLEDSGGMHRISRSRITTCDPKIKRNNCLNPKEIIFLHR